MKYWSTVNKQVTNDIVFASPEIKDLRKYNSDSVYDGGKIL